MKAQAAILATAAPSDAAATLAAVAAAVLTVGRDGHVTFANGSAEALFRPRPVVGEELSALLRALGAPAAGAPMRIALADGRTVDGQSRPLAGGASVVTLLDITGYVREGSAPDRDRLTGLLSRAALLTALSGMIRQPASAADTFAVLCISLDRFTAVNDALGHAVGDALLVKVAERLRSAAPASLVARIEGDEFAVVPPAGAGRQAIEALACRLVDLAGRTYVIAGQVINVGASAGIALPQPDGESPENLLKHAKLAVNRAKADGGGVARFFEARMDIDAQSGRLLENNLRKAVALKEFELAYQPQIRLQPDTLVGFEALLRWRAPAGGFVSPADFIPVSERIGLILPIGEWVLRTACKEAAAWPVPLSIAVNLSPVQFRSPCLVAMVASALAVSGLDPVRLELEITEGALLDNTDSVLRDLHALKALGVRISMDDFGTGFSSLSYLQKFPFDKIKIDQSFVRGSDNNRDCSAIVRAVAGLGASLGMKTTAEGIETQEQLARMRAEGCTEVQGYLTGRPMAAADIAALFRNPHPLFAIEGSSA